MTLDLISGGGTAERTFQISRSLVKAGAECDVLILDLGLTPERMRGLAGVNVIALPCLIRRYYVPRFSLRQIHSIVADADVVHLMGHWVFINALVYFFARRLGKPYVVNPAGSLPIYGRSKRLKRMYNWVIGKHVVRNADGHVAIVEGEVPQFEAYGIHENRITIIPNGINSEDYQVRKDTNFRRKYGLEECPFVLFVGRLNSIKGPDLLLRAFCEVKDDLSHHLVFAGPDEGMLHELRKIAAECSVSDRVHFVGYLGGEMKSEAYYSCDLLAIPSRQEAMSLVVLEAGATGTPVLLTDGCGFDEVAQVGGGKVVPASVEGLKRGLTDLLGESTELKSMGENLRRFVGARFSWDYTVSKYLQLYTQILKGKG